MRSLLIATVLVAAVVSWTAVWTSARESIFDIDTPASTHHQHHRLQHASPLTATSDPTTKIFLHERGVDLVQSLLVSIVVSDLQHLPLPDTNFSLLLGKVYITHAVIKDFKLKAHSIELVAPNQLKLDFTDISGRVTLDWRYEAGLVKDHGTGDNQFSQTSISTLFSFSSDPEGRPAISMNKLAVEVGHLDIHLAGGASWLLNPLIKLLQGILIKDIEKKINDAASKSINEIVGAIEQKYPLQLPMTGSTALNETVLNMPLVPTPAAAWLEYEQKVAALESVDWFNKPVLRPPTSASDSDPTPFAVADGYLIASAHLFFESISNHTVDPDVRGMIPDEMPRNPNGTAPMFGFRFDDYLLNSLLYSLTQNGAFNFIIDNEHLPSGSIITLTTMLFKTEYPALYEAYPDYNMSLGIEQFQGRPPRLTTTSKGFTSSNEIQLTMNVIDPSQSDPVVPVCALLVKYSWDASFSIDDSDPKSPKMLLRGHLDPWSFNIETIWTKYDAQHLPHDLQEFYQTIMNYVVLPQINAKLEEGLPMPTTLDALHYENFFLHYAEGVFTIGFDLALPSNQVRSAQQDTRRWIKEPSPYPFAVETA